MTWQSSHTVVNSEQRPGTHEVIWDFSNQTRGIFFTALKQLTFPKLKNLF